MVAVQQAEHIRKAAAVAGIQKNTAREGKIAVHIGIDVAQVAFPLQNRVINIGSVQRQPGAHIGVYGKQLIKGGAFGGGGVCLGFQVQHTGLNVPGRAVHLAVIPQRIYRERPGCAHG